MQVDSKNLLFCVWIAILVLSWQQKLLAFAEPVYLQKYLFIHTRLYLLETRTTNYYRNNLLMKQSTR